MPKQLAFDQDAREKIRAGVAKLSRAVRTTLGPRGRNAILDKGFGSPTVTNEGHTVAEEIELTNPYENLGAQLLKEAAQKTADDTGDGTTTATVLAEALLTEGQKHVTAGVSPMLLTRGLAKGVARVTEALAEASRPVKANDAKQIERIATLAAAGDAEMGAMIARAMLDVGKDGVITVEEGRGIETTVEVVQGMRFDRGFLSPHFVTNPDRMEVELDNALVLIWEEKISAVKTLLPLLELIAREGRPLLIIAEDVEGEALATLVVNKLRGILSIAAVKAPGYGDRRKAMLGDLAAMTGGKAFFKDLGEKLEGISLRELGQAKKVTVSSEHTTIVEGASRSRDVKDRIAQIRREMEDATSDYDREKLQERLARLAGGVAQILVGAATETDLKERKARVESALNATRAAVEEGIVPGGGLALYRAGLTLDGLKLSGDEAVGVKVLQDALVAPMRQIAENAGCSGGVVLHKVMGAKDTAFGFDADRGEFRNLVAAGIVDPTKVVRVSLQNAASVATLLLTTACLVSEIKVAKQEDEHGHAGMGAGMGGGMPGMGGMGGMGGGMPGMGGMGGGMPDMGGMGDFGGMDF